MFSFSSFSGTWAPSQPWPFFGQDFRGQWQWPSVDEAWCREADPVAPVVGAGRWQVGEEE